MVGRRITTGFAALAMGLGGIIGTTAVAGAGEKPPDFSKLKEIKEPANCNKPDPGITDDTIKVGVITIQSGPQGVNFAPSTENGMLARIEAANASGELGDRKIELVVLDDAADPARNLTAAQQLNEQDKVFGIIAMSNASKGGAGYLNEEGVPVGGWHIGEGVWGEFPNMFGWRNSQPADPSRFFVTRTADLLKKLGAKKIAVIGNNAQASATNAEQVAAAAEHTKGVKLVYLTTDVTPEQQDFTGVAAKIKEVGADGVYTSTAGVQANGLSEAMKQAGVDLKAFVLPGGYDDRVLALPGYEGAYVGTEFKPFEVGSPGLTEYVDAMEANGYEAQRFFGINGWFAADVFIEGIKAAGVGCPTRKAFINNLRLETGYSAGDSFIPVDFAKVFGHIPLCIYYSQITAGGFEPIFDGEPFCATKISEDGKIRKLKKSEIAVG